MFVDVPHEICTLPNLENFSFFGNFFRGEAENCLALPSFRSPFSNAGNCIVGRSVQKLAAECAAKAAAEKKCDEIVCKLASPSPPF